MIPIHIPDIDENETMRLRRQLKEARQLIAAFIQSRGGQVDLPVKYLLDRNDADRLKVWESDDRATVHYQVIRHDSH